MAAVQQCGSYSSALSCGSWSSRCCAVGGLLLRLCRGAAISRSPVRGWRGVGRGAHGGNCVGNGSWSRGWTPALRCSGLGVVSHALTSVQACVHVLG